MAGEFDPGLTLVIPDGFVLDGSITLSRPAFINGRVTGDLISECEVTLGPQAVLFGDILAQTVTVYGRIEGNLSATEAIHLMEPASVDGTLVAPLIAIGRGVRFNGHCRMSDPHETVMGRPRGSR